MKNFNDLRQAALPLLMEVPKPRRLDDAILDAVQSDADAVRACIEHRVRRLPEGEIAECLGLKKAHLSRVKSGSHNLTRAQQIVLQYLCSNTAIDQYAERITAEIAAATETPADTIHRLQAELAQARRAA